MPGMFQDHEVEDNYAALTRYLESARADAGVLDAARTMAALRMPDWLPNHYRWLDHQWRA